MAGLAHTVAVKQLHEEEGEVLDCENTEISLENYDSDMTGALTTAGQEIPGRQRQSKCNGMEVSQPNPDTSCSQKDLPT